jgi:hypothetical protein
MLKIWPLALLAATLIAAPARAQFEGELEMKVTSAAGEGSIMLAVGKAGIRNSMEIKTKQFPMKMVMLFKKNTPDVAYTINDQNKTWSEVDLKKGQGPKLEKKFTAKKLGTEKINGWNTIHALVTDEKGRETEVWTNKDILDWRTFLNTMGQNAPTDEGMMKALKDIGADGFFVKLQVKAKEREGGEMTMELVKATKKAMPASLFEIPKDYKKAEGGMAGAVQLPPEVQKQLMEKMKNMTPEQQEAMRRAMEQSKQ